MQLSLDQMDLEVVTQRFASGDRLWDISRTNPDGKEQESEYGVHAFKHVYIASCVIRSKWSLFMSGFGNFGTEEKWV